MTATKGPKGSFFLDPNQANPAISDNYIFKSLFKD